MSRLKRNGYKFAPCMNCGQMPTIDDTDLCGPCCYGEADSLWDWLWEDWTGFRKAGWYAFSLLKEARESGFRYSPEIEKRLREIAKEGKK